MPIDPGIALSGKPVQFDGDKIVNLIAQGQQRRMAAESHAQEMQLGQQRIAQGQLAAREAQLKQHDDEVGTAAYQQAKGDPVATVKLMSQNGARPQAVQSTEKHFADIAEQKAKTGKDELDVKKYTNDQLLGLHDQAENLITTNPALYQQQWPQIYASAVKLDPEAAKHFDENTPATLAQIQSSKLAHLTEDYMIKSAQEKRAAAAAQRDVDLHPDKVRQVAAEAQSAEDKAAGRAPIQPHEQAQLDLQQRGLEETAAHNRATQDNAAALLRVSQGRLGVEQQHLGIAKQIYDQTYGSGANPALVGVEPKLRTAAATAAQKAADEYTKAVESTGNFKSIIDLARSGNKVAYSYAPTTGVMTINTANGVKRVNIAEIKSFGGAGSAIDRVEGWLGKQATGASIPKDILDNMEQVNKSVSDNAGTNYNTKLGGINQNYRSNFQPVKVAEQSKPIRARDQQGNLHEAPAGTALPAGWKEEK